MIIARKIYVCCGALLLLAVAWTSPASARDPGLARMQSAHSVSETIDRLAAIVEEKGATVFARIDHATGAASIGQEMRPTEVLIFGNPKLGTPIIQADPLAGLDLPIRMLAFEDEDGRVWLVYRRIGAITDRHGITGQAEAEAAIAKAMKALGRAATSTK